MKTIGKIIIAIGLLAMFALLVCFDGEYLPVTSPFYFIGILIISAVTFGGIELAEEGTLREAEYKRKRKERRMRWEQMKYDTEKHLYYKEFFDELARDHAESPDAMNAPMEGESSTWEIQIVNNDLFDKSQR